MKPQKVKSNLFSLLIVPALSVLLLVLAHFTTGIRGDHFFLIALSNVFYYASSSSRRLIIGLVIFLVYWIIYDSMKAWPNWAFHTVDVKPLYDLEKKLFGIQSGNNLLTPNEYFIIHQSVVMDLICAVFYLSWIPIPLIFSLYLYFKNKNLFLRFCMAFFIVNCIGFIIYYVHPAAPPWYYALKGDYFDATTKSNAAGLLRFDNYFGINLFSDLYSKGSNVFAAMPSLHASYPLIGFIYALKQKSKFFTILFGIVMLGIWFAAIYLTHHYILDVLAGIGCGLVGILLFEKGFTKNKTFTQFFEKYESLIC